jgi:cellobiose PTS system EIIA component
MEGIELISFQIISAVGSARSNYIEAISEARNGKYDRAEELIREGEEMFLQGHAAHAKMITEEANGNKTDVQLLLIHAEDQLMSAEAFGILAKEFVELYKKVNK